jgi:hypothetical protein
MGGKQHCQNQKCYVTLEKKVNLVNQETVDKFKSKTKNKEKKVRNHELNLTGSSQIRLCCKCFALFCVLFGAKTKEEIPGHERRNLTEEFTKRFKELIQNKNGEKIR